MSKCRFISNLPLNSSDSQLAYKFVDDLGISALIKVVDHLSPGID